MQNFYWSYKIFFNITRKNITWNSLTTFIFIYFIFIYFKKYLGTFLKGNLLTRMFPKVYWHCMTSWGLFLLAESHFGGFLMATGRIKYIIFSAGTFNQYNQLTDQFAKISDWSLIKTNDQLFLIMFSAHMVIVIRAVSNMKTMHKSKRWL